MPHIIDKRGLSNDGLSNEVLLVKLAQQEGRRAVAAIASLTDSTTGVQDGAVVGAVAPFVGAANSGNQLASQTEARAALAAVRDAAGELVAKANASLTALGLGTITDNSGAAAANGTLEVIPATAGASTGVAVAETNTLRAQINQHIYVAAKAANRVALATGVAGVKVGAFSSYVSTIPAINTSLTGAAASPGVTKAELDVAIARWTKDLASIAFSLNAALNDTIKPLVVVQG